MSPSDVSHKISAPESMSLDTGAITTKLNTAYSRFARHLPDYPYILGVPDFDLPLKHPHELKLETSRWIRDSPFASEEAHLQYMTHVLRDPSDSCYELRTQVDEEREHRMKETQRNGSSRVETTSSTPKLGPIKKKISLADYNSKKGKAPISVSGTPLQVENLPSSNNKDKPSVVTPKINSRVTKTNIDDPIIESVKNAVIDMDDGTPNHSNSLKRKSPQSTEQSTSRALPNKKLRPDADSDAHITKDRHASTKRRAETNNNHGLPPMLSPAGDSSPSPPASSSPKSLSTRNPYGLPPMLSPTLPADLEKAWRAARKDRARANSDISSQSALSDSRSSQYVTPSKPVKLPAHEPNLSASQTNDKKIYMSDGRPAASPKDILSSSRDEIKVKQRLVVKLRYSKSIRKQIQAILRGQTNTTPSLGPAFVEVLSTNPQKESRKSSNEHEHRRSSPSRDIASETRDRSSNYESKKRVPDTDFSSKLHKKPRPSALPNGLSGNATKKAFADPPVTPTQDEFEPRKEELVTPKMQSGAHISTPQNLTPLPPVRINSMDRLQRSSGISSAGRPAGRTAQILAAFSRSLNGAGRELKHGAQALSAARIDAGVRQRQQALIILESNMAYMMAYSFQDEVNRLRGSPESWESTWHTLLPFLDSAASYTKHFPDLDAVRCYLAYATAHRARGNMLSYMISALAVPPDTSTPGASGPEHHQSPPDPSTTSHVTTSVQPAPAPHDPTLPNKIASFDRKARQYIAEASSKLPPEDVAKHYPRTWAAREQRASHDPNPARKERELMLSLANAGDPGGHVLRGPFWMPITEAVTPIAAVRFGVTICAEWARIEGVKHEPRLEKTG